MTDAPVLLLAGASSRSLEKTALERAARILCRHACVAGVFDCADCRRVLRREHPDLLVAAPETRRRANVPAFEEAGGSKETTIPTALVRAISAEASRRPYEGAVRVLLLLDVDRTGEAALNALLKVLEEPPPAARFLLTAARPRKLPPTILSRVVSELVPSGSREETVKALRARGVSADEAEARAAFSSGDADEAAELELPAARALRDTLLAAVSGVFLTESPGWALALADALTGDDNADTADRLTLFARLLRDAVAASLDPSARQVLHRERAKDLARLGALDTRRLVETAGTALKLAADLTETNRNPRLSAEAFALSLLPRPLAKSKR
jgi:DNA polymerase III delta prime subunit